VCGIPRRCRGTKRFRGNVPGVPAVAGPVW